MLDPLNSVILEGTVLAVHMLDDLNDAVMFNVRAHRTIDDTVTHITMPCFAKGRLATSLVNARQLYKRNMQVRIVGYLSYFGPGAVRLCAEHIEYRPAKRKIA